MGLLFSFYETKVLLFNFFLEHLLYSFREYNTMDIG